MFDGPNVKYLYESIAFKLWVSGRTLSGASSGHMYRTVKGTVHMIDKLIAPKIMGCAINSLETET